MVPSVSLAAARSSFLLVGTAGPPQETLGIAEHPSLCTAVLSSDLRLLHGVARVCPGISKHAGAIPGHSRVFSARPVLPALLACPACRICLLRLCSLQEHLGGLCGCCGAVGPSFPPTVDVWFPAGGAGQPQAVGSTIRVGRCVVTGLHFLSGCSGTPYMASSPAVRVP